MQHSSRLTALILGLMLFLAVLPLAARVSAGTRYASAVRLYQGPTAPVGVAVDGSGTAFWANYDTGQLLSLAKRATSPTVLLSGLNHPSGVAMDASGNIYYDEYFAYTVSELSPGSSTPKLLFNAGTYVFFLSADSNGNIYVVTGAGCNGQTSNTNVPDSILKWNKGTSSTSTLISASGIGGIFVTPSNDVYYTTCSGTVDKLSAGSNTPLVIINGLSPSTGVAVDPSGDVFFTQYSSGIYMLASGSSSPITVTTAGGTHYGLALDDLGDVFYSDNLGGTIWEAPVAQTQQVTTFTETVVGHVPNMTLTDYASYLAVLIAIFAVGLAVFFDFRLRKMVTEVKRVEIDEKIAMLFFYRGNDCERQLSDLRAVERVAGSADSTQAQEILDASDAFLLSFKSLCPAKGSDAETLIGSIKAKAKARLNSR